MSNYEIYYIPRVEDEKFMWSFETIEDAREQMQRVKEESPQAYKFHYIWDVKNHLEVE